MSDISRSRVHLGGLPDLGGLGVSITADKDNSVCNGLEIRENMVYSRTMWEFLKTQICWSHPRSFE